MRIGDQPAVRMPLAGPPVTPRDRIMTVTAQPERVWYVSYGSNMCAHRWLATSGGTPSGPSAVVRAVAIPASAPCGRPRACRWGLLRDRIHGLDRRPRLLQSDISRHRSSPRAPDHLRTVRQYRGAGGVPGPDDDLGSVLLPAAWNLVRTLRDSAALHVGDLEC